MNPTIKARIESIRRGEVPEGYKRTKAGILPVGWEFNPLSQLAQKSKTKNREERYTKILTNSANEGIISQTDYFDKQIANNDNIEGYYIVKKGDFVYNPRISVAAPCGPINCYHGEETGVMSPLYTVFSIDVKKIERDYVEQFFSSTFWHRYMKSVANYGVRSDRMNLSDEDFFLLPIPMPMRTEQEKIAEILAGQDRVIELKEKLLAEKQKQKKYLIQQLLTGKKRLPGFTGEWKKVKLGKCLDEVDLRTTVNNEYEILSVTKDGIVRQTEHFNRQIASVNNIGYKIIKYNQVAFSVLNLWMGSVDVLQKTQIGIISPAYKVFNCAVENLLPDFAKHFLRSYEIIWLYNINSETGASVVRKNLDIQSLFNCNIVLPPLPEQTAIAEILSAADKEIELLQKDIEQEKLKKKSLMQLLLTGIVRVDELVS